MIVTGGAGYIGSHTCKALAQAGFEPVCVDNLSRGHRWAVKWGPFEQANICDGDRIRKIIDHYEPCGVIHFAAFAYVGESVKDPLLYYQNNVGGSVTLLAALQYSGNLPVVFSSSCAVYGVPSKVPIDESASRDPVSPYGQTKLVVEQILENCETAFGHRSVALRYFNAAGADAAAEIGEAHDPEPHLIPLALAAAAGHAPPLSIFGRDYPTADGTAVRDYIHVSDLARAHIAALRYLLAGGRRTALNLGTGAGHSVLEVLKSVERVTGMKVPTLDADRRAGDPPVLVANVAKAKEVLNFSADLSNDIDTIISSAWEWMKVGDKGVAQRCQRNTA